MKDFLSSTWPIFIPFVIGIFIGLAFHASDMVGAEQKLEKALVRAEVCEAGLLQYQATLEACVLIITDMSAEVDKNKREKDGI